MIERCRAIYWDFVYPQKRFVFCLCLLIGLWVLIPVALTWQLSKWNDAMLEERMYLKEDSARQKKQIQILQELLDRHIGGQFFGTVL